MSVLVLAALNPQSGNNTTASRICEHVAEDTGYHCISEDTAGVGSVEGFLRLLDTENVVAVLGIHALHAGRWLVHSPVPYAVIFGGTDVNLHADDPEKLATMRSAVQGARVTVAFSESMMIKAAELLTDCDTKDVRIIPQAVITHSSSRGGRIREELGLSATDTVLVIVGGVRPVKDQLYLLQAFSDWHIEGHNNVYLVIIGPVLDQNYAAKVFNKIKSCPGVLYAGGRALEDTHGFIQESWALVNCSSSEGQATAILEAMALGTPVIARDIPANLALVEHGHTGLVFSSPQDFLVQLELLLGGDRLRTDIQARAAERVRRVHSCTAERQAYTDLVHTLVQKH